MSLAASVSTPGCKKVKSALVQIELSKLARQVETLPLRQLHGRTSFATQTHFVSKNKDKLEVCK